MFADELKKVTSNNTLALRRQRSLMCRAQFIVDMLKHKMLVAARNGKRELTIVPKLGGWDVDDYRKYLSFSSRFSGDDPVILEDSDIYNTPQLTFSADLGDPVNYRTPNGFSLCVDLVASFAYIHRNDMEEFIQMIRNKLTTELILNAQVCAEHVVKHDGFLNLRKYCDYYYVKIHVEW